MTEQHQRYLDNIRMNTSLLQDIVETQEHQLTKLKQQLSTAISLLCSNRAVVLSLDTGYVLHVQGLENPAISGSFSPQRTPYQAVREGIKGYIEWDKQT